MILFRIEIFVHLRNQRDKSEHYFNIKRTMYISLSHHYNWLYLTLHDTLESKYFPKAGLFQVVHIDPWQVDKILGGWKPPIKTGVKNTENWWGQYNHQRIGAETGEVGNKRMGGDHLNNSAVKIGQNTKKSPGDLRRLAVTQDSKGKQSTHAGVKNSQMSKIIIIIIIIVDFAVPVDHRIILKESEKKDKYLDLARELKKAVEHESDDCANCDWCVRHNN